MDCLSPSSPVEETICMKGVQVGFTVGVAGNFIGYTVDQAPGVMLIVMPTVDTAKRWSRQKLAHLLENCPALKGKVADSRERDSQNTMLAKEISGGRGMILITGANSAVGLRSTSAGKMIFDEVDAYPQNVDGEGDPVSLAEKRSQNYRNRKLLKGSTPIDMQTSRILKEFERGDQRYYFVPCPHCGHFQVLQFDGLIYWPKDKPEHAVYQCSSCHQEIEERHKTQMLERGRWVATYGDAQLKLMGISSDKVDTLSSPPIGLVASYHLATFYSPVGWKSWLSICKEWVAAQENPSLLKVFVNTIKGEAWDDRGVAPDWRAIYDRREDYPINVVPTKGLFLTAAADVQLDRLEVNIKAWGPGKESWTIAYEVFGGDTAHTSSYSDPRTKQTVESPWQRLEKLLTRDWSCEGGGTMPITALGIDCRYRSSQVYEFAIRFRQAAHGPAGSRVEIHSRTVVPLIGGTSNHKIIESVSDVDAAKKRNGLRIVKIGPAAKQDVYDRIKKGAPAMEGESYSPDYAHFPAALGTEFFQGLCSEYKVVSESGSVSWKRDSAFRNEALDTEAYNRGMAELIGISNFSETDWAALEERKSMMTDPPVVRPAAPARPREDAGGGWLQGRGGKGWMGGGGGMNRW